MDFTSFIASALAEDIGDGDHTSQACIPKANIGHAKLLVKDAGTLAGVELARQIFNQLDDRIRLIKLLDDGAKVEPGDIAFTVEGPSISLLKGERLVLNCMQRMSGIATTTAEYVEAVEGTGAKVLDTRKTTPGIRAIEKWAVKIGGGVNHRFGLYDMIMIKDNHVDFAGGISAALIATEKYLQEHNKRLKVIIETRNLDEVREVMETGKADRILLDNFDPATTKEAVQLINGQFETESSGGITLKTIRSYAECGVNYISVGALTHSVTSLDLSLKAIH